MPEEIWITTYDNPFDPFTQWDQWYDWDVKRYDTCGELDRLSAKYEENLTEEESDAITRLAMKDLYEREFYPTPLYRFVSPSMMVQW